MKSKRYILVLTVAAISMLMMATAVSAASEVYNPANGHVYLRFETLMSAPAARTFAGQQTHLGCSGYLATITSEAENSFVMAQFGTPAPKHHFWLGGYQDPGVYPADFGWKWVTGEPWEYTRWRVEYTGEPNDYGGPGAEQNLGLWMFGLGGGYWNDGNDISQEWPLVEFDAWACPTIDVKPGSTPNPINDKDRGVIPVAILTGNGFDASTVDPLSLSLDGAAVRVHGKSGKAGALEDVDGDGDLDLIVQFAQIAGTYGPDATVATLTGLTVDGRTLIGHDAIHVVP